MKTKFFIAILFFSISASNVFSANWNVGNWNQSQWLSATGIITATVATNIAGHSDLGIANANINLIYSDGTVYNTTTDTEGYFIFDHLLKGEYTLTISSPHFKTLEKEITLNSGENLSINDLPYMSINRFDFNGNEKLDMGDIINGLQVLIQVKEN